MVIVRQIPWTSFEEFQMVQQWLYSDSPEEAQKGLDRVAAWASRGKLPPAIASTAAFVQLRLRDRGVPIITQNELRLQYAMSLIRFVNGIVDPLQRKAFIMAISDIAESLQLPLWFVELRHASTHEYLPGISILRDAADQALHWLHDYYWTQELQADSGSPIDVNTICLIRSGLKDYKDYRKLHVKESKTKGNPSMQFKAALGRLRRCISAPHIRDGVIPELLSPGGLVPISKKKRPTLDNMKLSKDLIDLWILLVKELDKEYENFGKELIDGLLKKLDVQEKFRMDGKVSYVAPGSSESAEKDATTSNSYLLTIVCYLNYIISHDSRKEPAERIISGLDLNDIIEHCLRSRNIFTREVLKVVVSVSDASLRADLEPFLHYIDHYLSVKHLGSGKATDGSMEIDMDSECKELADRLKEVRGDKPLMASEDDVPSDAWTIIDTHTPRIPKVMENNQLAESTIRIKQLHDIEKKLVDLVETAGDAIAILCDEGHRDEESEQSIKDRIAAFQELASRYFTLVNEIQTALRSNTRFLRKTGSIAMSTTKSIPFRATISGQQKELEVWTAAIETIHQRVEQLRQIAHEQPASS
ncbi:Las1-like-domain-containing protein [Dichotomocladium elegans]|nr:Las1-like-domain-containing protein [Dichotomocladium elegans]